MTDRVFPLTRRCLLTGLGASAFNPAMPATVLAQTHSTLALQVKPGTAELKPGIADTAIWSLEALTPGSDLRFKRGDKIDVSLSNSLPVPVVLNWRGIDGAPAAESLMTRQPLMPGGVDRFMLPLRHAGTFMVDTGLLGDGQIRPSSTLPLVVQESEPIEVDRDEIILIEDWRLGSDGNAMAPGTDAKGAAPLYTVNGKSTQTFTARSNERLRIRFINGCQRNAIAIKIEDFNVRIMAIDGQPSEPFLARNGQIVLAPGTRIDAFVDAVRPPGATSSILLHDGTELRPLAKLAISGDAPIRVSPLPPPPPLPSNGLPAQLDLKNAIRLDLPLTAPAASPAAWIAPTSFSRASTPAFRAKRGRTVVLALNNPTAIPVAFHLHGHHFRLLDRLDDGWKPFWLDTLLIDAQQTQRIAFAAEFIGAWLMEATALDWGAPRLLRWFTVD